MVPAAGGAAWPADAPDAPAAAPAPLADGTVIPDEPALPVGALDEVPAADGPVIPPVGAGGDVGGGLAVAAAVPAVDALLSAALFSEPQLAARPNNIIIAAVFSCFGACTWTIANLLNSACDDKRVAPFDPVHIPTRIEIPRCDVSNFGTRSCPTSVSMRRTSPQPSAAAGGDPFPNPSRTIRHGRSCTSIDNLRACLGAYARKRCTACSTQRCHWDAQQARMQSLQSSCRAGSVAAPTTRRQRPQRWNKRRAQAPRQHRPPPVRARRVLDRGPVVRRHVRPRAVQVARAPETVVAPRPMHRASRSHQRQRTQGPSQLRAPADPTQ